VYVATERSVKFSVLKVRNVSGQKRDGCRPPATIEWVLGDLRPKTVMHVITEVEPKSVRCWRACYNTEFPDRFASSTVDDATRSLTGDRAEFLGRNGALGNPAAMARARLRKVGAALDPCAPSRSVRAGGGSGTRDRLQARRGRSAADVASLVQTLPRTAAAHRALDAVHAPLAATPGCAGGDPDASLDVLANGWLLTRRSRAALGPAAATTNRECIRLPPTNCRTRWRSFDSQPGACCVTFCCAARSSIREGESSTWAPRLGRGVRTRCSDDTLAAPRDGAYGKRPPTAGCWRGRYRSPEAVRERGRQIPTTTFPVVRRHRRACTKHCVRAIQTCLQFVPTAALMGSGDWNDGMNLVGSGDGAESVWAGFFLCTVLEHSSRGGQTEGDTSFADRCDIERTTLRQNLEQTPGTASRTGERISTMARRWARRATSSAASTPSPKLVGALGCGRCKRSRHGHAGVDERLVRRDPRTDSSCWTAFDKSALDPATSGLRPGVRETRRPVHPRCDMGGHGLRGTRAIAIAPGNFAL